MGVGVLLWARYPRTMRRVRYPCNPCRRAPWLTATEGEGVKRSVQPACPHGPCVRNRGTSPIRNTHPPGSP